MKLVCYGKDVAVRLYSCLCTFLVIKVTIAGQKHAQTVRIGAHVRGSVAALVDVCRQFLGFALASMRRYFLVKNFRISTADMYQVFVVAFTDNSDGSVLRYCQGTRYGSGTGRSKPYHLWEIARCIYRSGTDVAHRGNPPIHRPRPRPDSDPRTTYGANEPMAGNRSPGITDIGIPAVLSAASQHA